MTWLGIDFSGNAAMWRRGCSRSNVWIAELADTDPRPTLTRLIPVQQLPGSQEPFDRLARHLRTLSFAAAAIDAPFSVPGRYLPTGGRRRLLDDLAKLSTPGRPFPRGSQLLDLLGLHPPLTPPKPWRATEEYWRKQGINVRSALWNGPRGGAPFTAACLKLHADTRLPCWPWVASGRGLLVEGFPAAQLKSWGLPYQSYDGANAVTRETIWRHLRTRVATPQPFLQTILPCADAVDAIVLALTARAVTLGLVDSPPDPGDEGWIAVQP